MGEAPSVVVFIDYQNAHNSAHRSFCGVGTNLKDCALDPARIAEAAVKKRAPGGIISQVRVYRGHPDPRREPRLAQVSDRQKNAWQSDGRVVVLRRTLKYPRGWEPHWQERPREKGVDVSLAVDLVRCAVDGSCDVAMVVSRDTDLEPALEAAMELGRSMKIEASIWEGDSSLKITHNGQKLRTHLMSRSDWSTCIDPRRY